MRQKNITNLIQAIFVVGLFWAPTSHARSSIVVIQGSDSHVSRLFLGGISSHSTEKITAFRYKEESVDEVVKSVLEYKPDLIFTIGELPIDEISRHKDLARVHFIGLNNHSKQIGNNSRVVLVEERMPLIEEISLLKLLYPQAKTIGTMYDSELSQESFNQFVDIATKQNLKVASIKVDSHKAIANYAPFFEGKIDCFYFLPDYTTSSEIAIKELYKIMKEKNIPVISGHYSHLESGALFTLSSDPYKIGEEAWNIAEDILKSNAIKQNRIFLSVSNMLLRFSMERKRLLDIDQKRFQEMVEQTTNRGYRVILEPIEKEKEIKLK